MAGQLKRLENQTRPGSGIDRTVIRQLLAMTPAERVLLLIEEVRNLAAYDRARRAGRAAVPARRKDARLRRLFHLRDERRRAGLPRHTVRAGRRT